MPVCCCAMCASTPHVPWSGELFLLLVCVKMRKNHRNIAPTNANTHTPRHTHKHTHTHTNTHTHTHTHTLGEGDQRAKPRERTVNVDEKHARTHTHTPTHTHVFHFSHRPTHTCKHALKMRNRPPPKPRPTSFHFSHVTSDSAQSITPQPPCRPSTSDQPLFPSQTWACRLC